ncbi:MAG: YjdF family protein [Chloroflexota bacterium]
MMRLTILFDAPYWVGILEVERDNYLYAARYIFGAEPSDQEVYEFVQRDLLALLAHMTTGLPIDSIIEQQVNPKRAQREVRKQIAQQGITSQAHDAMRLQIEQNKQSASIVNREQREALREYKRDVARAKAKARHRGH